MNHTHVLAPASNRSSRTSTRAVAFLLSWWAGGACYAVDFPSQPLQTGVVQPAPNIVFILDDSQSMVGTGGLALNSGMDWTSTSPNLGSGAGAPYTKNPLSYNPATTYKPWATANTADTAVLRLDPAEYDDVCDDAAQITSCDKDLTGDHETYYVPKSSANQDDPTKYYRYQIRKGGSKLVRSEWVNTDNTPTMSSGASWTNEAASSGNWTNVGGNGNPSSTYRSYTVPAGATQVVIATSGGSGSNRNPGIYVNVGSNPNRTAPKYSRNANNNTTNETLTIDPATPGEVLRIGVYNHGTGNMTGLGLTVTYTTSTETVLGCTVHASSYGWKNCTDISTSGDATYEVRKLDDEKQNYANWYQFHRSRMKVAKAGGSEAFASLDKNYRVGLMGLYPSGTYQQVIRDSMSKIIPVDTNGGLFVGDNRKDWFDHLHTMSAKNATPLRKALNGAGKYFSTEDAYRSKVGSDPATYLACRQNFAILTTDGYWNNYSGSDDKDENYTGDQISGDEEDGALITKPGSDPAIYYRKKVPYWYSGLGDYNDKTTLADIAMHYWKTDLLTADVGGATGSAENRVPYSDANPAFWQHMVTFGVGLGVKGKLSPTQVSYAMNGTGGAANIGWPAPNHTSGIEDNPENVDDLRHAALNSRGSYINANNSKEFSDGIANALNAISERKGSASNVLANSTSISTESFVYQATYTAGTWRGELLAYPVSGAGLGKIAWWASKGVPAWGSRNVFTVAATGSGGSAFPNTTQTTELGAAATSLGLGVTGTELAQYLKGDPSHEVDEKGTLRNRFILVSTTPTKVKTPTLLGDIVDSSPFYVADIQTIFVGANDGMLHAIDASNTSSGGTERFTYIPRGVAMGQLAKLAEPMYGNTTAKPHLFFVDGPIVVSNRVRTPAKNYLVGALGRGGKGVYGLDVTTPGSFANANVLWDNTGSTDPAFDNMGNVISEPLISKMNNGATAAVVANGPNSTTGTASLFILNLDTGAVIKELNTATTGGNGLSAPRAVDVNVDGKVDFYFAGDLLGNMWRFDVSDTSASNWTFDLVFSAKDPTDTSVAQPISSAPGVARDPANNIWVFFGTGRYMTAEDQASTNTQSYYGIKVGPTGKLGVNLTRTNLQPRSIQVVDAATGRRAFQPAGTAVDTSKSGWYIDLNKPAGAGERVISAPLIFDDILIFSSIVPPNKTTLNSCDAGGTGYINALDAFTGTGLDTPFFVDLIVKTIKDGTVDLPIGSLPIGAGMPTAPIIIGNQLVVGDSSGGTPTSMKVNAPGGSSKRRVSWRELLSDQ